MKKSIWGLFVLMAILMTAMVELQSQVPDTDIYLIDFKRKKNGKIKLGKPLNFTPRKGYDNQPSFIQNGNSVLYTSIMEGDEKSDIYMYDIERGEVVQITNTDSTSEYSPVQMPDAKYFSVVRVEEDDSTQRMWKFPFDMAHYSPELLLEKTEPVGYYTWYDSTDLAMFILGDPMSLHLATPGDTSSFLAAGHVGRCIQRVPASRNRISFVHKLSDENWVIKELNTETLNTETITETLPKSEDYCWTPEGELLMGSEGKLYIWSAAATTGDIRWREIADFTGSPLEKFYRIAISPTGDRIALVTYANEKP